MSLSLSDLADWFNQHVLPLDGELRGYLQSRFGTAHLDDVLQETYLRVLRAKERGRITNARTYAYSVARNAAIDLLRHQAAAPFVDANFDHVQRVPCNSGSAYDHCCRSQEFDLLRQAIRALPARCRRAITLRGVAGMSHRQIAKAMGVTESTSWNHVANGIRMCQEFLTQKGIGR